MSAGIIREGSGTGGGLTTAQATVIAATEIAKTGGWVDTVADIPANALEDSAWHVRVGSQGVPAVVRIGAGSLRIEEAPNLTGGDININLESDLIPIPANALFVDFPAARDLSNLLSVSLIGPSSLGSIRVEDNGGTLRASFDSAPAQAGTHTLLCNYRP